MFKFFTLNLIIIASIANGTNLRTASEPSTTTAGEGDSLVATDDSIASWRNIDFKDENGIDMNFHGIALENEYEMEEKATAILDDMIAHHTLTQDFVAYLEDNEKLKFCIAECKPLFDKRNESEMAPCINKANALVADDAAAAKESKEDEVVVDDVETVESLVLSTKEIREVTGYSKQSPQGNERTRT